MKRRMFSMLMVMIMVLAMLPVTTYADAAENIYAYGPTYHDGSGALASISTKFEWTSGAVKGRLILSSKELGGGKGEAYSGNKYGSFTNSGIYATSFGSFADAQTYNTNNGNIFGFITYSDEKKISTGADMTLAIPDGIIPMTSNAKYYVYLWAQNGSHFYPDNLICVIQVENGALKYTSAKKPTTTNSGFTTNHYRNYYEESGFQAVPVQPPAIGHNCQTSGWLWNDTHHWRRACVDSNCNNYPNQTNKGTHVFVNDYDTDCDCGYTRTAPAEKPETGDITHIPMWTALFLGGLALLWVQLEQRKRQQY